MKTLFLITSLEQGGIETYLLRYLEYFQEHEAIVICKSGGLGELYPQYTQMVRVIPMYFSYFGGVRYYRYYKLLKREQVDTVCDFTGNTSFCSLVREGKKENRILSWFYKSF